MSCHAILKSLYEPKMDVILTANFKVTAEIEWHFVKHNYVHSLPGMRLHCFVSVNSLVNAARSSLRTFARKSSNIKFFLKLSPV